MSYVYYFEWQIISHFTGSPGHVETLTLYCVGVYKDKLNMSWEEIWGFK